MTRREALKVNQILLALLTQKRVLKMVGLGVGMTEFDGELLGAMTDLASIARGRLGMGLDGVAVETAFRHPERLWALVDEARKEALEQCA